MKKTLTAMGVMGLVLQANDALARELDQRTDDGAAFTGRPGEKFDNDPVTNGSALPPPLGAYPHYIFTSSASGMGAIEEWSAASGAGLVGRDAADYICQLEASGAGLPNHESYVAWMSDNQNDAYCRAHGLYGTKDDDCGASGGLPDYAGPWVLRDDQLFGGELSSIIDNGEIYHAVDQQANGAPFLFPQRTWTGTRPDGTGSAFNCNDWTSSSSGSALFGDTASTAFNWTDDGQQGCSATGRLTCLSTATSGFGTPPAPPYVLSERRAFVTSIDGPARFADWALPGDTTPGDLGLSGIEAADEICQTLAASGGLANADAYKALVSDSNSIYGRFDFANQLYRLDHAKIVDSFGDFFEPGDDIHSGITLDQTGTAITSHTPVWTGMDTQGLTLADNCGDWTIGASGESTSTGVANYADLRMIFGGTAVCSASAHLYCISDSDELSSYRFSRDDFYD